jgi:hypothetical protein
LVGRDSVEPLSLGGDSVETPGRARRHESTIFAGLDGVIKNTAVTPTSGTCSNLPNGAIVNGNNLQASYSGGDGNDLTLTVMR